MTKPKIGVTQQRLHKLMALVPITDELLADSNALESYIPGKVAASNSPIDSKTLINRMTCSPRSPRSKP